jgi:hypothetical protein
MFFAKGNAMKIGNETDARFIHDWLLARHNEGESLYTTAHIRHNPPEGWTYLGEGSYRSVWESPEGVAYKVQHHRTSFQSNEKEYECLVDAHAQEGVVGTRLPACSFYPLSEGADGVLAMECVKGQTVYERYSWDTPLDIAELMIDIERAYGLRDMHSENVMIEEETKLLIPVDFGY